MKRELIATSIAASLVGSLVASPLAGADPRKLLVLKSEGDAPAAVKAKVDAEVLRLAHTLGMSVEAGEITFADAVAAVGCSGGEAQCRDDILGTMGVDEVIAITVTTMASGDTRVLVDRIPKGSAIKNGQTTVASGQPVAAKIAADIGPMFGVRVPPAPEPAAAPGPSVPGPAAAVPAASPPQTIVQPAFGDASPESAPPPASQPVDELPPSLQHESSSTGPIIGLAAGGALLLTSLVMWGEASSTQGDINNAPTKTSQDFQNLQNLENTGDMYARLGNVFFVGGLVVAGISGYFFWRGHRAHANATQAVIVPTLFDHGGGLALTIGGSP